MNEINISINWESVKEKIFLRLVNYEKYRADMEGKAYIKFLDLAILFYCDCTEWGCNGFYVSRKQILMWHRDINDIYQAALENTYRKDNTLVTPILNFFPEESVYIAQNGMDVMPIEKEMIVLANQSLFFGAAMLLNIPVLKKLADQLDSNLYLLPSSVHEIIAVRSDPNTDVSYLTEMVNEANYRMDYKDIMNLNYLEPEGTFRFGCNCCGHCCKERGDILLTAYDIMRLQKYLDISFKELLITYCEMYVGKDSGLPIIRLRTDARCPFLFHNKCFVQDAKPTVCALFPLGRIYDGKKVRYFIQENHCGTGAEEHSLREWLEQLGTDNESCCILWGELLKEGVEIVKQVKEQSDELKELILSFMVSLMYDDYDSKGNPISQIQERIDMIKQLPGKLSEFLEMKKMEPSGERM